MSLRVLTRLSETVAQGSVAFFFLSFVVVGQLNILAGATNSEGSQHKVKPSTDQ